MTAREFAENYLRNSSLGGDLGMEWFDRYFEVWSCQCGADDCRGFKVLCRDGHPLIREDAIERGEHPISLQEEER